MLDDRLSRLPHRPPMRLVEEVVEVQPGTLARTRRRTRPDDWFFDGHFPGQPVVPAIVFIELIAQTGGLAAVPEPAPPEIALALRVAAVADFKFPAAAGSGTLLETVSRVVARMGRLIKIDGRVTADGQLVAHGSVTLADVAAAR